MSVIIAWVFLYLVVTAVWVFVNSYPYEIKYGIKETAWQQLTVLLIIAFVCGLAWSVKTLLTQG